MFGRIAVVDRGEPAVRFIRAVRDARGRHGMERDVEAAHLWDVPAARLHLPLLAVVDRGIARGRSATPVVPREVPG